MTKACSVCKTIKVFDCFYKALKSKDGCGNRCKECELAYQRSRKKEKKVTHARWYAANKKTILLNERIKTKEKRVQKYSVIFSSSNEDGVEKWRKYRAKRVLAKVQATPSWVDLPHHSKINEIYAITQQLQEATGSIYHVDHIVPLVSDVVCGLHVWWNLQPMPEKANMLKNNLFEPLLYPEQGEVAFPLRNGPITTRTVVASSN